jgi:hypothetical protein
MVGGVPVSDEQDANAAQSRRTGVRVFIVIKDSF